jgi:ABC-2 type transport system permease protein
VVEGSFHTLLIILVFVVPMLTMKVIAEERRSGTFELLITSPLQVRDIVVGKLLAIAGVLAIMILVASSFPLILAYFGEPEVPPMLSGMLAVFLSAVGFASIGIAVSSCTDNQIIAAIVTLVILLVLYAIDAIGQSFGVGVQEMLRSLSPVDHARGMIDGVIETKSLVYFGLLIVSGAFLSCRSLEAFRWR